MMTGSYHAGRMKRRRATLLEMEARAASQRRRPQSCRDQLDDQEFRRVPGLYRLWDLPVVMRQHEDYRIDYAELTEEGAPLFAVYRVWRSSGGAGQ